MQIRKTFFVPSLLAALGVTAFGTGAALAQKPYHVAAHWKVAGDQSSWDYLTLDPSTHRLFLSHQTEVAVIDTETGKEVGSIKDLGRAHGTVLIDAKLGFISDGTKNRVVVFDPSNYATLGEIPTGGNPDGMVFEPATKTVWCFNGNGKNATVIDVATKKAIATVAVPGKPEFPVAIGDGTIFDNIEDINSVIKIDAKAQKVVATYPLKGCESPSGLALDKTGMRLFSVCDGSKMAVTDAKTGKQLGLATIGDGPDAAAYDPKTKLAYASNDDGTLSVVDAGKPGYPTVQTLKTQKGARTMTLDYATGTVYTATAELGKKQPGAKRPDAVPGSFTVLVISR